MKAWVGENNIIVMYQGGGATYPHVRKPSGKVTFAHGTGGNNINILNVRIRLAPYNIIIEIYFGFRHLTFIIGGRGRVEIVKISKFSLTPTMESNIFRYPLDRLKHFCRPPLWPCPIVSQYKCTKFPPLFSTAIFVEVKKRENW